MYALFAKKTNSKSSKSTRIKKIKMTSKENQRVSTPRKIAEKFIFFNQHLTEIIFYKIY
jgi:hypothetical protein